VSDWLRTKIDYGPVHIELPPARVQISEEIDIERIKVDWKKWNRLEGWFSFFWRWYYRGTK
jgi:hypothetical protein